MSSCLQITLIKDPILPASCPRLPLRSNSRASDVVNRFGVSPATVGSVIFFLTFLAGRRVEDRWVQMLVGP